MTLPIRRFLMTEFHRTLERLANSVLHADTGTNWNFPEAKDQIATLNSLPLEHLWL